MSLRGLPRERLSRQLIGRPADAAPHAVVARLGAIQAQDYLGALWALGLRTAGADQGAVEAAIAAGDVLRTHLFRHTWQYVARDDLRWMLGLVGRRVIRAAAGRYREFGLDERTLKRAGELFRRALDGGGQFTRREMQAVLVRGRLANVGPRLIHILAHAELDGVLCSGGRRGRQATYALLDERVPRQDARTRDEALAELATRYFGSRGPATARDFSWWSGLPLGEATRAIELAGKALDAGDLAGRRHWTGPGPVASPLPGRVHLLPPFDEYLVAYRERGAVLDPVHARAVNAGGGMFNPILVVGGAVTGTWSRTLGREAVTVTVRPFRRLGATERRAVLRAARRYGEFLGLETKVVV